MESIKALAIILGAVAFFWRLLEAFGAYLRIRLDQPQVEGDLVWIRASVENKGTLPKGIDFAALLVSPLGELPGITVKKLACSMGKRGIFEETDDIVRLKNDDAAPFYDGLDRAIVPLPFFYEEQKNIGDELLAFRASIARQKLSPGPYEVRLFVFRGQRLHRSTHEAFDLSPNQVLVFNEK